MEALHVLNIRFNDAIDVVNNYDKLNDKFTFPHICVCIFACNSLAVFNGYVFGFSVDKLIFGCVFVTLSDDGIQWRRSLEIFFYR